jgi:hypothetical protein
MADEPRPPYVKFEIRTEEDRQASVDTGHFVGKDVIYALVTPPGTKDRIEKVADDWIANIEEGVKQERIPDFWLSAYRRAYDDFKNSRETPESGTPVKDWPSVSASQVSILLDMNIRTVEELAGCSEEACGRMGMGGRALKQKAKAWLDSSNDIGKAAEELNSLRVENKELRARDNERERQLKELEAKVNTLTEATKQKEKA